MTTNIIRQVTTERNPNGGTQLLDLGFDGERRDRSLDYCHLPCGHLQCASLRPNLKNVEIMEMTNLQLRRRVEEIKLVMAEFAPPTRWYEHGKVDSDWRPVARRLKSETQRIQSVLNQRTFEPELERDLVEVKREMYHLGADLQPAAAGGAE